VYFTNPNPPDQVGKGIDNIVVPVINAAKRSIDVTSFDLNLPSFVNALVAAQQRGVKVRVVVDDKNGTQVLRAGESADGTELDAAKTLSTAGITVVGGGRSNGLMHDKIIIVDGVILFMGSWNMSYNDTFRNNNNMLVITSQRLIDNYEAKFNELFVDQKFGAKAKVGAQNPQVTINNVEVDNYFSPVDKVMDKIVTEVNKAQKSVKFMAFTYTDARLSGAMIAQFKKGIKVQGVIENRGASQGALPALFCAKVPVETDGNKYTMHHKVIIIDDQVVITGSFNFTNSADTANDDNILIIRNASVAALYTQEFDRIYAQGNTPTSVTCN
jgi:phosphatidylserine/phosphatidylglycerophosphate/cardiolipin synthase-like enzyme